MKSIEQKVELVLFASRWLLVPFYLGLIGALLMILAKFGQELLHLLPGVLSMGEAQVILAVLSLVDLTLTANLVLMVMLSGYENSVSALDLDDDQERPEWLGQLDLGGLKLKLISSMVAISGIHLLKTFMNVEKVDSEDIKWMVIIHIVFVASGVLLAIVDWLKAKSKKLLKAE